MTCENPRGIGPNATPGSSALKPTLLVVELWGMGDLVIATPFLQAASRAYNVSLVAKPYAFDLQRRFWPEVRVIPFIAPWTAFRGKYRLWEWPWREFFRLRRRLAREQPAIGLSARWDPRDHLLLALLRARRRLGFPRWKSDLFLSDPLERSPTSHRYEHWRVLGRALGLELPGRDQLPLNGRSVAGGRHSVLVHTGAGQPVRVWPLDRYARIVARLRRAGHEVIVACDPDQRPFWTGLGEKDVAVPQTVTELMAVIDRADAFLGNDSGPSHLAAFCGVPTFTLFGPQLPEWFAPLNPKSEWLEGKPCPYKPCSDYCRFPVPYCMVNSEEEEVWTRLTSFLQQEVSQS